MLKTGIEVGAQSSAAFAAEAMLPVVGSTEPIRCLVSGHAFAKDGRINLVPHDIRAVLSNGRIVNGPIDASFIAPPANTKSTSGADPALVEAEARAANELKADLLLAAGTQLEILVASPVALR